MKLRPFELALVIIFGGLALMALVILKTYSPETETDDGVQIIGSVQIWGTMPGEVMNEVLDDLSNENKSFEKVYYRYYHPDEFDYKLVNALADGTGPDLIFVSQEKLVEMRKRIQPISFESFPIRDIRNQYIDGAHIFALDDGLYGYPIVVDPLMVYWNKDIFANKNLLASPVSWEDLVNGVFPKLIERDFDRTIRLAVVAMGEYGNVRNAFGVMSTLFIQGGSQTVSIEKNGFYEVMLRVPRDGQSDPFRIAADFYTRFGKPSNTLYSWNRSYKDDRLEFISENLAMYFGYGSEGVELEKINPNLNFDVAEVPQGAEATVRRTYGKFYALSLLKSSTNETGASAVMFSLGSSAVANEIAVKSNMVPAHRSLVLQGSNDTYGRITYKSAQVARGWLNPDLDATNDIFTTMTKDINENRRDLDGAVGDAVKRLEREY